MQNLKKNMILGFVFVSVIGTLWHFIYKWTGDNLLVGFIAPINESVFEHMKLIFFPGIIYLFISRHFLKDEYKYITNSMSYGILAGTAFLPVFFYTYSNIFGKNHAVIDIASFYIGVLIMFLTTYKLVKADKKVNSIGRCLLYIMLFIFLFFTYNNSSIGIFSQL